MALEQSSGQERSGVEQTHDRKLISGLSLSMHFLYVKAVVSVLQTRTHALLRQLVQRRVVQGEWCKAVAE